MKNIDILKEMIDINGDFNKLYEKGLISVSSDYIHLEIEFFITTFTNFSCEKRYSKMFNQEAFDLETEYNGLRFIATALEDDLDRLGIKKETLEKENINDF